MIQHIIIYLGIKIIKTTKIQIIESEKKESRLMEYEYKTHFFH